jgi:heterodisulfide reductase subunit D
MIALYALFFAIGTVACVFFGAWNVATWFEVADDFGRTVRNIVKSIFSRRILRLVKAFFSNSLLFTRLSKESVTRGAVISGFLISYIGVISINHLMAEAVPKIGPEDPVSVFLYAPFLPAYFFQVVPTTGIGTTQNLYGFLDNLFIAVIIFGEIWFAYRKFVLKETPLRTTFADVSAIILTVAWLVVRLVGEGMSLLQYDVPASIGSNWFIAYGISLILEPLRLDLPLVAYATWSLSGLLLALFMASITLNSKLWHIFTGPLVVLTSLSREGETKLETPLSKRPFSVRQMVEIDGCLSCGVCSDNCEVYSETADPGTVYVGIIKSFRSIMRRRHGLVAKILRQEEPSPAELKLFSRGVYYCTLCARCREVCPIGIDTRSLGKSIREFLVTEGHYPANLNLMRDSVASNRNVLGLPNSERAMWVDYLPNPDETLTKKTHAEVAYFVGCMSSFSPTVQDVPVAFAQILQHAGVDFAILGEKEWCCGYPLVWAGMPREAEELRKSNIDRMTELGVKTAVFSCPSCYHMWRTEYDANIELLHHTQYILRLIKEGRIHLKPLNLTVTYHDPCDLGRNSGEYDAPRDVIRSIPDISFVEMRLNREKALCCGGGGDVEVADENFPSTIAKQLISLAKETGAGTIVTACQQCKRTMVKALSKGGAETSSLKVVDLAELVIRSIEGSG